MNTLEALQQRSDSTCELCSAKDELQVYAVPPDRDGSAETSVLICPTCQQQIENPETVDVNHWRCLNESMWSQIPVVQVVAWRMLTRLRGEGWPQELLEMLYLDEPVLAWAQSESEGNHQEESIRHLDSNGTQLAAGDTITLIKDLNVKGAGFTAKRGTTVRGISLAENNPEHIEGRVNGQQIVILTKFVKKA